MSLDLANTYFTIGNVYAVKGDSDEALKWLNKALNIQEQVLDSLSPKLATSYLILGGLYIGKGDNDKGLEYFNKILLIFSTHFGEENEKTITMKQMIEQCKQALEK